jgi:protein-S-isoprenylcysteine O-methyltransferase Ste14
MNFLTNPWNVVFFVGWVVYLRIRGVYAQRTKRLETTHRQVDLLEKILLFSVIAGSTLAPLLYLFTPLLAFADYGLPTFAPWVGTAIMLVALELFWRSHADLGQNWSVSLEVRKNHQLITHGVYQLIRHPMYASIWLWGIAQALLLPNWLAGWSLLVPFAAMYFLRVPREERMMRDFFGQQYIDYMAHTGRLFPRNVFNPYLLFRRGQTSEIPTCQKGGRDK